MLKKHANKQQCATAMNPITYRHRRPSPRISTDVRRRRSSNVIRPMSYRTLIKWPTVVNSFRPIRICSQWDLYRRRRRTNSNRNRGKRAFFLGWKKAKRNWKRRRAPSASVKPNQFRNWTINRQIWTVSFFFLTHLDTQIEIKTEPLFVNHLRRQCLLAVFVFVPLIYL